MRRIKVLIVKPYQNPYVKRIRNTTKQKQKIINGLLEFIELEEDVDLIFNEESKMLNFPMNKIIENDIVCGTFIVAGQKNGDSISLTNKQVKKYQTYFSLENQKLAIELLSKYYKNSELLINCDLTGIEKLLLNKGMVQKLSEKIK